MVKCIARSGAAGGVCLLALVAWSRFAAAQGKALSVEDKLLQQRFARLGCEQDLVACIDAESGRIVSRQMSAAPFATRSGELWTVKVVGPKRLAASYTFEEHRGAQLYSTVRGSSTGTEKKKLTDVQTEVKDAANTLQRLDTSQATKEAVLAARNATSSSPGVRDENTLDDAQKKAQVILDKAAKSDDDPVLGPSKQLVNALAEYRRLVDAGSQDVEVLASYALTIADDITVGRQSVGVAATDRKELQATVAFQIVDHGRYVLDFALGGAVVADGDRTYTVVPQTDGTRRISTESYASTSLGFFMNVFPGGHRKGIVAPWLPVDKGPKLNFLRDMVALQLGLALDFTHISDLERFARRGFVGIALEPVTGVALSTGAAMGIENTLRDGVLTLPAGTSQVPESAYRDTFKVRWYFAVTLSPEIVSLARVALSGATQGSSSTQE